MEDNKKHIVIDNERVFADEIGRSSNSFYSNVVCDSIHFKNLNFNLLEPKEIRCVRANKITFENCILGNLHYMNLSYCDELHLINQKIDSYFINSANPIKNLYLTNNSLTSLSVLINRHYNLLSIKGNNIKGNISSLANTTFSKLKLEEYEKYSISDLEYLKDKLENKKISKLYFNEVEIDEKKLFYLERKIKVQKLIKMNA